MDCIDCHNRPTHIYVPPDVSVDRAISGRTIDVTLPFIKQQGVAGADRRLQDHGRGAKAIAANITKFYQDKYPQIASAKADSIKGAVVELQRIYSTTFFPYMKVNWKTHPNNIGHFYYQGCFRCHDGNHVSKDGKVISKDCNSCHTVLEQQESGTQVAALPTPNLQASGGHRRPDRRELLRLPQRRSRAVGRSHLRGWGAVGGVQQDGQRRDMFGLDVTVHQESFAVFGHVIGKHVGGGY